MSDWIGLGVVLLCIFAVWLARRRSGKQVASAIAAVRLEGFEAGRAAVLASIGSTVVVNNQLGNGSAGFDAAAGLDTSEHDFGDLAIMGRGSDHRFGARLGVPVDVHTGDAGSDPRLLRAEALSDAGVVPIGRTAATTRRDRPDVTGRGPGQ